MKNKDFLADKIRLRDAFLASCEIVIELKGKYSDEAFEAMSDQLEEDPIVIAMMKRME